MRFRELLLGTAALLGLLTLAGPAHAGGIGCSTCGPAPLLAHGKAAWQARFENWQGCANCNPRDPFFCGSTGANGSNGYCNQRFQAVRRIGVLTNHNQFMGDSWLHRYQGGFNFSRPAASVRQPLGVTQGF